MEKCLEYLGSHILSNSVVCGEATPCGGDEGSPLFIRDKNERLIQIGVAGRPRESCNSPHPFARISKYLDWIESTLLDECESKIHIELVQTLRLWFKIFHGESVTTNSNLTC